MVPQSGTISIQLPATTISATDATQLDGVLAGWTWDAAFVNRYRFLCVCNDAIGGHRRTYIDGVLCRDEPASVAAVAAGSPLALFTGCAQEVAEYNVWDNVALDPPAILSQTLALRGKWNILVTTTAPNPVAGLGAPLPTSAVTLPVSLTTACACWLDASHAPSLANDAMGVIAAAPGQNVRWWRDRSGNGRHVTFPAGVAQWSVSPADWIGGKPHVHVSGAAGGGFTSSPLQASSGFTIVAVWQTTAGGGHPFPVAAASVFTLNEWTECIDVDSKRIMPIPSTCGVEVGDVVVACWMRNAATGTMNVWLRSAAGVARAWSATATAGTAWLSQTGYPKIGGGLATCSVPLGELLHALLRP